MPKRLTLLPCPNPYCFADKHPRIASTGVDCMTQCNHTVQCSCGITVAGMSIEEAVDTWNALPRALEWTNEPPKVPGCYLGRKKGGRISMVIYCFYQKDELGFWNGKKFCTFEQDATEYFGPIPEPREPK